MEAFLHADWPAPASVRALTTLRHGLGVSAAPFDSFNLGLRSGDDRMAVQRNRDLLAAHAALPAAPRWLRQVHGTAVWRFAEDTGGYAGGNPAPAIDAADRDEDAGDAPVADAAVTAVPGCVLAILTADCLPVLFAAKDGSEVAAAHAGWRGLSGGVLEATLAAMRTPPDRVLAWLGPAAGPRRYEIGIEVYDAFVTADANAAGAFVPTRPNHWTVDLYALARRRLQMAGMAPTDIHGGGLCTIADPQRFFSHRRDRRTGRMASLVWIGPGR